MPETEPTYYDRDELTRPGHVPSLITDTRGAHSSCSCGWESTPRWGMTGATLAVRQHIATVDRSR